MAIIQISRIQVRRGREQQGTGVPRLASGELGWAVDTQRLFIGSGNTQEGAPSEGNVRLLTENDNILNLSSQYYYGGFDEIENTPFITGTEGRTLQDRLDDFVSAKNFGVIGNGTADDTDALQFAINALFGLGVDRTDKSILYIPGGTYRITRPLEIPPHAYIVGAGIENTVIISSDSSIFKTVGDNQPNTGLSQETQARNIKITDMSLEITSATESAIMLDTCRDSEFKNFKLTGPWTFQQPQLGRYAFEFVSNNNGIINQNNIFENITINNFEKAFWSEREIRNNKFNKINLSNLKKGFEFGILNTAEGPSRNIIENCEFVNVKEQGILVFSGDYNTSRGNRFINVGNDGGNFPEFAVIDFKTDTNISVNDYFDRTELTAPNTPGSPQIDEKYVPEVAGRTRFENLFAVKTSIGSLVTQPGGVDVIKIPMIDYGTIFIDYVYTITNSVDPSIVDDIRQGVMEITVNNTNFTQIPILLDDYTIFGDTNLDLLIFEPDVVNDTIIIRAKSIFTLTNDFFYYTVRSKT